MHCNYKTKGSGAGPALCGLKLICQQSSPARVSPGAVPNTQARESGTGTRATASTSRFHIPHVKIQR